jgi:hypothetical protein
MSALYVFTEERSAGVVVKALATRYVPNKDVKVIPHSGKSDLCSSFPRKMRSIQHPAGVRFIVLHDNDGADCRKLKTRLLEDIPAKALNRAKIRLVMQELEGWYLGQLGALEACGLITSSKAAQIKNKAKFRNPDLLTNAKQEFYRLHDRANQQITLATMIAPHLDITKNCSQSFKLFVSTLQEFAR